MLATDETRMEHGMGGGERPRETLTSRGSPRILKKDGDSRGRSVLRTVYIRRGEFDESPLLLSTRVSSVAKESRGFNSRRLWRRRGDRFA